LEVTKFGSKFPLLGLLSKGAENRQFGAKTPSVLWGLTTRLFS
jgi:hypothetical protein